MTLNQFFQRFRNEVDDLEVPFLWTDDDLESYLNMALEELAKKALYFSDEETWAGLTVTADDPKITATSANKIDRILDITRTILVSTGRPLAVLTMSQADTVAREDDYGLDRAASVSWETQSGTPQLLITDYYSDGSLRLGPIPSAADTINLWTYRLPLDYVDLAQSKKLSMLEATGIREHSHELVLLQGMKWQAYLKEDPETRDDQLATQAEANFKEGVLEIKYQLLRRRHPVGKIKYGGI